MQAKLNVRYSKKYILSVNCLVVDKTYKMDHPEFLLNSLGIKPAILWNLWHSFLNHRYTDSNLGKSKRHTSVFIFRRFIFIVDFCIVKFVLIDKSF